MREATLPGLSRAVRTVCAIAALLQALACGSSSETFVAPVPSRCAVQAETTTPAFAPSGGTGTVRITTNRECAWSAQTDAAWVAVQQASGSGEASVQFTVAPNSDTSPRNAGLKVNDQRLQISQEGRPCQFKLSSTHETVDGSGGQRTVQVQTTSQCTWAATAGVPWITITGGRNGTGNGNVVFEVAPTTGPSRAGTLSIAGQSVQVTQGIGCTYATGVTSLSLTAAGGSGEVPVQTAAACPWVAESQAGWITIASGSNGSGPGVVRVLVPPTEGPPRTGTITVAGVAVTITQSSGCGVAIQPASHAAPVSGGAGTVTVRTGAGCPWSAASNAAWIAITSGASGAGDGQVQFAVTANTGPGRSGSLTIGGQTVSVSQPTGCTFSVSPPAVDLPPSTQTASVSLATGAGCLWNAATNASWISLPQSSGSGPGQISFVAAANNGPRRSDSLTVAGHRITVNQDSPCTWALAPPSHEMDANGGRGNVLVIVIGQCTWTAASTVSWITIESGASGTGNALLQFAVAPNSGPARTGIIRIAGIDYLVRQAGR